MSHDAGKSTNWSLNMAEDLYRAGVAGNADSGKRGNKMMSLSVYQLI